MYERKLLKEDCFVFFMLKFINIEIGVCVKFISVNVLEFVFVFKYICVKLFCFIVIYYLVLFMNIE